MDYLDVFSSRTDYDNATLDYPNVSYIIDENVLIFARTSGDTQTKTPLTFEFLEMGNFFIPIFVEGRLNGQSVSSVGQITVDPGDKLTLFSNSFITAQRSLSYQYGGGTYTGPGLGSNARYNVYGNLGSLELGENLEGNFILPLNNDLGVPPGGFSNLFAGNPVVSAKGLEYPELAANSPSYTNGSFINMFITCAYLNELYFPFNTNIGTDLMNGAGSLVSGQKTLYTSAEYVNDWISKVPSGWSVTSL